MAQSDFSGINFSGKNKASTKTFHDQRNIIKNICRGQTVLCLTCQKPLKLITPSKKQTDIKPGVRCDKGCTDIELDFAL